MEWIADHLAILMFLVLTVIMFVGYPVAFVLGGVALGFGVIGIALDVFRPAQFGSLIPADIGARPGPRLIVTATHERTDSRQQVTNRRRPRS